MPYVDPQSASNPTAGGTILSAWGDTVRDSLQALAYPPTVRARRGTNQSVPDSTDTGIAADELDYDSHAIHSVVSGRSRFTVPANWDGEWEVGMTTNWQNNGLNRRRSYIRLNGTLILAATSDQMGFGGECEQCVVTSWQAVATDYFEFMVWQDSGLSLNLEPVDYSAQTIWARWVRGSSAIAG